MSTKNTFINREKRFEVTDKACFDTIVSRAGSDDSLFYGDLIDFSRNGMKLNVPFFAKFDEVLKVQFDFKDADIEYAGNLRVRHIRNIDDNSWQVGCSCNPPLPEEVISHFAKQSNQERRRKNREDVKGAGFIRKQGSVDTYDAEIINISEGGFCLEVAESHDAGERIDFTVYNRDGNDEIIEGRVRWQQVVDDRFHIGCSFVTEESYPNLLTCLTTPVEQVEKSDKLAPQLIIAAMVAMMLPSITYFFMHSNKPAVSQAPASTIVNETVASLDASSQPTTPTVREQKPKTHKRQVNKETKPESGFEKVRKKILTSRKTEKATDSIQRESKQQRTDHIELAFPNELKAPKTKQLPASRSAKSQPRTNTIRRELISPFAGTESGSGDSVAKKRQPVSSKTANSIPDVPSTEIKSSPIPDDLRIGVIHRPQLESGIPEELTKRYQMDSSKTGGRNSTTSSRRIKYKQPMNVPSEKITDGS